MKNLLKNQRGFSLLEVVVALSIFAVFATAFVQSQGTQVNISMGFQEELTMRNLAQQVINEMIMNPPELNESIFAGGENKTFEDNPNYSYNINWYKFTLPDFSRLKTGNEGQGQTGIEQKIAEKVRENMERLVFQLEVTIINKQVGNSHTVTTWLYNDRAVLELNRF